eukprot:GHVO01014419.1.p1 GENE.GHVO01014419.1~~GHVO01014419.1.p1  ORF type:complete len:302 (+),score=72.79 GHVO01014419.1:75-908(+)
MVQYLDHPEVKNNPQSLHKLLGFTHSIHLEALLRAIQKGFEITENNYIELAKRKNLMDGCTVLLVFLYGPDTDGYMKMVTANVGDSRAVMCSSDGVCTRLTTDHKPNDPIEMRRIIEGGGRVSQVRGVWRAILDTTPVPMGLAVARAIGDYKWKRPREVISWRPDVEVCDLDLERVCFILLGTDGIWDVWRDEEACLKLRNELLEDTSKGNELVEAFVSATAEKGSADDKTAVVVLLDLESPWTEARTIGDLSCPVETDRGDEGGEWEGEPFTVNDT